MGPLPAYFYAAFQLIDYSIHSWDIKSGLGRVEPLSDAAAVTLIPFMMIVKPSEFVLSTYQRVRGGTVAGDAVLAERIRDLLLKI